MIYGKSEIISKAWLVKEVVNLVLCEGQIPSQVDKIFLIGSYANGTETEWSDLDFLVQLMQTNKYQFYIPTWKQIGEINRKIDNTKIHVIFGTEEAAKSLHEKHKNEKKPYIYKELDLGGLNANTSAPNT